jgi:hypothetical protein
VELQFADEAEARRYYLFRPCETQEELHDWIVGYLGLDLPDVTVDPDSNSNPMAMVWEVYKHCLDNNNPDFNRVLYYACRDGFKTLGTAVLEVLAIFHLGRSVAHMAAIEAQSIKAQEYVKYFFRKPWLRDFVVGDSVEMTKLVRYYNPETKHSLTAGEYAALSKLDKTKHVEIARTLTSYSERENYIKIIICTMRGANSEHVPLFVIDEVDVVANPAAYEEAQNIPAGRDGMLDLTILTSTRKSSFGAVQDEINRAEKTGLHIRHWNVIDITARCEPARHRPDLPRLPLYVNRDELRHTDPRGYAQLSDREKQGFTLTEGFNGCGGCKLFAMCQTRLATHQTGSSPLLKPIHETINKFKKNSLDMAKAQLMCWKPSAEGLIYSRFDRTKHILSPAQAYAKIFGEIHPNKRLSKAELMELLRERDLSWYGGMDFGYTHPFAYIHGFKDGARGFITHCVSMSDLEPDQQVAAVLPFRSFDPSIYADPENPQMIKVFKKAEFTMQKWKKGKGSVLGGISIVQAKLSPVMGNEPELYFIHDADEDPGMDRLVQMITEYHWKVDAGNKPTNEPTDTNDDEMDALRYLVMNVFHHGGGLRVAPESGLSANSMEIHPQAGIGPVGDPHDWLRQQIALASGQAYDPPPEPMKVQERPRMVMETPKNSSAPAFSYYGSADKKPDIAPDGKTGKKGRLIFDLG